MPISEKNLNLNSLKKAEFERAKLWWKRGNISNFAIVILGLIANIFPVTASFSAVLATLLVIFSFVAQWISDNAKDIGDWALRQFEMWDGIGWVVNKKDLSDVLMHVSKDTRAKFEEEGTHLYFDSKKDVSAKRLVDNFTQSAFYTKHQAFFIAKVIFGVSAAVLLATIFSAIIALQYQTAVNGQILSYVILTAIQLVIASGYLRLGFDYWQFGSDAEIIENRACAMAERHQIADVDAIRLANDYQIIRSHLPLIPEWVWKRMEQDVNKLWIEYRNS